MNSPSSEASNRLYPEDQQKVDQYLSAPEHQVERKAFRPLLLLTGLIVVLCVLTLVSYSVAKVAGSL